MNGTDLLADFKQTRSERAFGELVRRYTNLVYSVALRRLSNATLAEEVTQTVFIQLAERVPNIRGDAELAAWLHRTTVYLSINLWRSESRRRAREEKAAAMEPTHTEIPAWTELAPVLDEALNDLNHADRQAILLRFFDHKTMRDLGESLGVSEDAAKMRVSRAMDRLRGQLSSRGVTCGVAALGTLLAERSVEAAPANVAARLAAFQFPILATATTATGISLLFHSARAKLWGGLTAAFLTTALIIWVKSQSVSSSTPTPTVALSKASTTETSAPEQIQALPPDQVQKTATVTNQPDPLSLLQAVAKARLSITSGAMEFEIITARWKEPHPETNHLRLAAVFDGSKRRFESFDREYHYTVVGSEASEKVKAKIESQDMDRDQAVRAGYLEGFESHHVTAYDGDLLLNYWETDGKPVSTTIDKGAKGSISYNFDPRCLGLTGAMLISTTVENCLALEHAKSVKLIGQETVEENPAWHLRVELSYGGWNDFWIDLVHPDRVLKSVVGNDIILSKYDNSNSAIPSEVITVEKQNGTRSYEKHIVQSKAEFNVPVDPVSWTLAGLKMPVGTEVVDIRIERQIGYWTGAGLSENLPRKDVKPEPAPKMAEMLAALEKEPASPFALELACWILLNTPDGPEVEKAAAVILQEHIESPHLALLSQELGRIRHQCARKLLEAMLAKNPDAAIRAEACFTLATLLKDQANYGRNQKATDAAIKLFERSINEFGSAGEKGARFAREAAPELSELRRLSLGKPGPESQGTTLDGQRLDLRRYRGKVVLLVFWSGDFSESEDYNKLLEHLQGKAFAMIGVNCDHELSRAKASVKKYGIAWPSFFDGRSGPIATDWNVNSWVSTFILDRAGVIRHRDLRGPELEKSLEALLAN